MKTRAVLQNLISNTPTEDDYEKKKKASWCPVHGDSSAIYNL